jgi:hypothetical protein
VRAVPELAELRVLFERSYDRRAAFRLYGDHLRPLLTNPAELLHLLEGFPHSDYADAAAGRIQYGIRQLPVELLSGLYFGRILARVKLDGYDSLILYSRALVASSVF